MKNKKIKIKGSEIFFESLLKHEVEIIFGYPGGAIMPVYDAMTKYEGKINHILTGHEQGAVHAAEGYARIKRKPGICLATSGPGATNFVTGIADAMMDSVPIICITGQVATNVIGTEAFQETNIVDIVRPITKWAYQIKQVSEIEEVFDKAFQIAMSGRPGPVLVDFPKDIQLGEGYFENIKNTKVVKLKIKKRQINRFASLLKNSKYPLVFVGNGVKISDAREILNKFLEKTNIPVATTLHGRDIVDENYKNNFGMLGMHGNVAANMAVNKADLIVAIGMRFDDRVTGDLKKFAVNAKIVHVDIDKKQIGKKMKTDLGIVSDAKTFLVEINKVNFRTNKFSWGDFKSQHFEIEKNKVIDVEFSDTGNEIKMAQVINEINKKNKGETVIVPDVGQHQMTAARYISQNPKTQFISSGGLGTMGFSLPASIGAYFGDPTKIVVSISGDGGFQMNIQELATIMRYKIPLKIFILNNSYLGMVRQWQEMFYDKNESCVALENPDFIKIAEAYNIKAFKIDNKKDLKAKIKKAFDFSGPVLVEVVCKMEEKVFPIVPTGFGVDEMVFE